MSNKMPHTPFSTPLSGSAREAELRLRNIFSGPKKRPPVLFLVLVFAVCLLCGNLVSCQVSGVEPPASAVPADLSQTPDISPIYTLGENCDVLIEGLEGAHVEWNRDNSPSGGFLYFAHDPGFCCPSLAGRTAEGSAQWKDQENRVVSATISVNDDRLADGTIDGCYLHFVADLGKGTVVESAFEAELGEALELSEEEMLYAGRVLARLMYGAEWILTADVTVLPQRPDLNRNGVPEELRLYVPAEYGSGQQLEIWEDGKRIYQETGDEAHVGWNAIFLCTLEGEDYLLHYSPYMGQGAAGYGYHLSTLEGNDLRNIQEKALYFEVNFGMPTPDGGVVDPAQLFDPEAVADFMDEINDLLSHSVQLLNTDQELLATFEREGRLVDTLFFLHNDERFTPDPRKSLRENIQDYYRTMAELCPGREGSGQPPEEPAGSPTEKGIMPFDRPLELYFLSGAGGWSTDLRVLPDGSFVGDYHDSDMGDGGENYPRGTEYICTFHGKFKDVISVSEHAWSLTLEELVLDTGRPVGEEWIENGVRYVSSDPYGFNIPEGGALEPGAKFMLYSPEARGYAPTDELYGMSEDSPDSNLFEFWSWWPNRHSWGPGDTLDCWGLRSLASGYGFFSEM